MGSVTVASEAEMNFRRGHQMVIHDPNLNNPFLGSYPAGATLRPPTGPDLPNIAVRPPDAYNVWTVRSSDSPSHIAGWAARVAREAPTGNGLDALHFMAHGSRAHIGIGASGFDGRNASEFARLRRGEGSWTRFIVFLSCLVGSDERGWYRGHPRYFGQQVAQHAQTRVVMAHENQAYGWDASGALDFGTWEGPVDVFEPNGNWATYQDYNPFRPTPRLDLEALIFGGR